ncbi:hypothetical protein [Nostoc flagelliforme]|uniref:hypothetical protein n=1 Tax=Nostoc flagelliforme TaxID=1306274 RepID=UPI0018F028E7|nr:hypothetical protein [Nostoc flagelliforme]
MSIAVNPSKIRRYKGEGSGSIHWRTITKNGRDYQQAYYDYEFWSEGDPKLRGKGGCWAIVSAVNEFSCTARVWDGEYTVGLQHLKSYDYLPAECQQMQSLSDRISRVYSDSLEETVKSLLQSLGKLNRPCLTVVEEKLLSVVELEYGNEIRVLRIMVVFI